MFTIEDPCILPLGDGNVPPFSFATIRKEEGDAMDELYVSIAQDSYLFTQTAAS